MLEHWIWLSECKIGLHQKALLLRRYQDAETIYGLDESEYVVLGFNEKERTTLREKDLSAAQRILENCVNQGIRILTYQEARYPNRLRQLEQPPVLLYYKGQIPEFDTLPVIAAIGARKMSAHGYEMAKKLGYQMGRCGLTVISGIAAGIDAASLEGALMADAPVAAVLGCGADIVYPAANRRLYADVELEGCLLTEYPPGSRPEGWHFPVRNRLLAGLSVGVLVVEAGAASGSLITVRHALEQGKDIFAVPSQCRIPLQRQAVIICYRRVRSAFPPVGKLHGNMYSSIRIGFIHISQFRWNLRECRCTVRYHSQQGRIKRCRFGIVIGNNLRMLNGMCLSNFAWYRSR